MKELAHLSDPYRASVWLIAAYLIHLAEEWFGGFPEWSRVIRGAGVSSQEFLLSFDTPAVTTQPTVATDDTMTGREERQWIRGAGPSDSPGRGWLSDELCDLTIGLRLPCGDLAQGGPYLLLKLTAVCIKSEPWATGFDCDSILNRTDVFRHGCAIL